MGYSSGYRLKPVPQGKPPTDYSLMDSNLRFVRFRLPVAVRDYFISVVQV